MPDILSSAQSSTPLLPAGFDLPYSTHGSGLPPEPEPEPTVPPPVPKKHGSKSLIMAVLLFLLATLPLAVYFTSQQRQLADFRGRAQEGAYPPLPIDIKPPTVGAPQSTFDINTAKCSPSGGVRTYSECCGSGKSRVVQATCLSGGNEQFDIISTCNDDGNGACGTATQTGPVTGCRAGWFFWPKKDGGDDQCHDVSAPANPGGGTSNCSKSGGCTPPTGGCIKTYTCSSLTPQGFCLSGQQDGQANKSYQDQANATCQTIQIDAFTADQCASGVSATTPHSGTIIYHPNPSSPACGGTTSNPPGGTTSPPGTGTAPPGSTPMPTTPPGSSPTPTSTPTPIPGGTCELIKLYDSAGTEITQAVRNRTKKLAIGEQVTIATTKGNATKARFRIQGIADWAENDPSKTTATEYRLSINIPSTLTQSQGTFEVEVFVNGVWK